MSSVIVRTTAKLIAWMHDEYLSELLLRACKPKPHQKKTPSELSFEWGLVVPDSTKLQMYGVQATGVTRWTLAGEWRKDEAISFPAATGAAPIVLHQEVPGLLALECARLDIARLPDRRFTPPPRARANQFLVWGPRPTSWRELLTWLEPPADVHVFEHMPGGKGSRLLAEAELIPVLQGGQQAAFRLQRTAHDEVPWLWVSWQLAIGCVGHSLSLERGTLVDSEWTRARALPGRLGDCQVISGTIRCSGAQWVKQ